MDISNINDDGSSLTKWDRNRHTFLITDEQYYEKRKDYIGESGHIFETQDDIMIVVDTLVAGARDVYVFPVDYVYDPKMMIKLGLWPTSINLTKPWVVDWLDDMDIDTVEFWSVGESPKKIISNLHDEMNWKYRTMETIKIEAIREANSIALKMYAPELLYEQSKRPVTDMSLFRSPLSLTCKRKDIINDTLLIENEMWNVIPITRYAIGMSRGLYYEEDIPPDTCGTFYYYEKESSTLLAYKKLLKAFNKTDAAIKLGNKTVENNMDPDVEKHMNGFYPKDLMMTPEEIADMYESDELNWRIDLPQIPHYAAEHLSLYAAEDYLDQIICREARKFEYDIVILENMVGAFQIVTEVLDTRSREDSFKSLIYLID